MKVQIWADVVCPWCYVGKRRFESALAQFAHRDDVEVTWRSFELDPTAAPSAAIDPGGQQAQKLAAKYGKSVLEAQQMIDQMTKVAADEGLAFRPDLNRSGNSFDAHRILHLALAKGVQDDLKEHLDSATFTAGLAVSDHDELTKVAVEAGLDETEVREVLASDRYADAVRADVAQARALGITGVPFFVIDDKFGVSGAQPPQQLLAALNQAWTCCNPERLRGAGGPGFQGGAFVADGGVVAVAGVDVGVVGQVRE